MHTASCDTSRGVVGAFAACSSHRLSQLSLHLHGDKDPSLLYRRLTNLVAVGALGVDPALIPNMWFVTGDHTVNSLFSPYNITVTLFFLVSLPLVLLIRSSIGAAVIRALDTLRAAGPASGGLFGARAASQSQQEEATPGSPGKEAAPFLAPPPGDGGPSAAAADSAGAAAGGPAKTKGRRGGLIGPVRVRCSAREPQRCASQPCDSRTRSR